MAGTAPLRVQLEAKLKSEVEDIFRTLGLSAADAITLFYRKVKNSRGLPFDINTPNEETLRVMRETDEGKNLVECENFDDFVKKLEI
ncbi:MAG: type II toxin-antitoxin system RelB/DinJ family antitoxin [bacterium]|nr:type II toxin-antitoxin system RelB/DinJ family antitoxin [bacterium]